MSDVGLTGGWWRERLWHWFWHRSGTVLALSLAPPLPLPGLVIAPYMHSSTPVYRAPPALTLHPSRPRVHHPAPGTHAHVHRYPAPTLARLRRPWGSLWAAPVARTITSTAWPAITGLFYPLIGTLAHAPCVTLYPAITARVAIMTLPWSTFITLALMTDETPARACL